MLDFTKYKFPCTSLGKISSNSRAVLSDSSSIKLGRLQMKEINGKEFTEEEEIKFKKLLKLRENSEKNGIVLSAATETFLKGIYIKERYGSRYNLIKAEKGEGVPQMVRGIKTERDAVDLLSEIDNSKYYIYKKQIENDYLVGKLDVIDKPTVEQATKIFDIKSASSIIDFFDKIDAHFTKSNMLQMQGYFAITGIDYGEIVHCLVGEPKSVIEEQEQLLFNKMCPDGIKTDKFVKAWRLAKDSMLFNDIPKRDRIKSKIITRDDEAIDLIYETISTCRNWLQSYHEIHETYITKRYIE